VDLGVLGREPYRQVVDHLLQLARGGRRGPAEPRGGAHLPAALRIVGGERLRAFRQVARPAAPARHDQREPGAHEPAGHPPAQLLPLLRGSRLGQARTPPGDDEGQVPVGLPGQQARRAVARQLAAEVGADQRRAQARDEEPQVVALQLAEQGRRAVQQQAGPVDHRERPVQPALDAIGQVPVGGRRLIVERHQQVKVAGAGDGGPSRDAAVQVGAVHPASAERRGQLGPRRRDHRLEGARHPRQRSFPRDRRVRVQPPARMVARGHRASLAWRPWFRGRS
jgi:hypothetical protein